MIVSEKAAEVMKEMIKTKGVACVVARILKKDSGVLVEIICPVAKSLQFETMMKNGFLSTAKITRIVDWKPVMRITTDSGVDLSTVSEVLIDNISKEIIVKSYDRTHQNILEFKFQNPELAYIDDEADLK